MLGWPSLGLRIVFALGLEAGSATLLPSPTPRAAMVKLSTPASPPVAMEFSHSRCDQSVCMQGVPLREAREKWLASISMTDSEIPNFKVTGSGGAEPQGRT